MNGRDAGHSLLKNITIFIIITLANFLLDAGMHIGHAAAIAGSATSLIRRNIDRIGRLRGSIGSLRRRIAGLASILNSNSQGTNSRDDRKSDDSGDLVVPRLRNTNIAMALGSSPL